MCPRLAAVYGGGPGPSHAHDRPPPGRGLGWQIHGRLGKAQYEVVKGSDAGVPRPDPHPISQPWPGLSTSHGSGWRRAEAASEIGNSLGTSACAPAIGHIISPQLVQGAVPAMPPQACSVHLIALVLLSCPVLGLAAAVPWIGRQAQKLTKPAREGLGRPWEMDGTLKSGKGSHLPRCPFIQQTFLGLTLEGGICAGGQGWGWGPQGRLE